MFVIFKFKYPQVVMTLGNRYIDCENCNAYYCKVSDKNYKNDITHNEKHDARLDYLNTLDNETLEIIKYSLEDED
jgi:hypothetical protein